MPRKRTSFASRVKSRRSATPAADSARPAPAAASAAHAATPSPSPPAPRLAEKPQRDPDDGFVAVGRVLGPFGLKGEVKVQPLSDNPERFAPKARLWAGQQIVTVLTARAAQAYVYLTLKGFHDRESVDKFRHALLQVPESDLAQLPEGAYYRFQLMGLTVVTDDGTLLGTLDEIIETGANDVYRVHAADGADVLLPALGDVILGIDLDARRMVVNPPEWR